MQLKILVPSRVVASVANVERIVVMTPTGSFGLLPQQLDCAAVLSPGLLTYCTAAANEFHLAVDAGVLVKTGADVIVCVRHVIAGTNLDRMRQAVQQELIKLEEQRTPHRTRLPPEGAAIRALVELRRT